MTHIMRHGFHACDSFEHMTWFMSFDWLTECWAMTNMSQRWIWRNDSLQVIEVYVARGDESPGLGLWEDAYIRRLVLSKGWARFSQTSSPPPHFTYNSQLYPALRPDQTPRPLFLTHSSPWRIPTTFPQGTRPSEGSQPSTPPSRRVQEPPLPTTPLSS